MDATFTSLLADLGALATVLVFIVTVLKMTLPLLEKTTTTLTDIKTSIQEVNQTLMKFTDKMDTLQSCVTDIKNQDKRAMVRASTKRAGRLG